MSNENTDGSRSGGQPVVDKGDDKEDALTIAYLLGVTHGRDDERAKIEALRQPTQNDALREALEAAPLIGRTESVSDFMARQDAWLKGPYRAAMQEQSK